MNEVASIAKKGARPRDFDNIEFVAGSMIGSVKVFVVWISYARAGSYRHAAQGAFILFLIDPEFERLDRLAFSERDLGLILLFSVFPSIGSGDLVPSVTRRLTYNVAGLSRAIVETIGKL